MSPLLGSDEPKQWALSEICWKGNVNDINISLRWIFSTNKDRMVDYVHLKIYQTVEIDAIS